MWCHWVQRTIPHKLIQGDRRLTNQLTNLSQHCLASSQICTIEGNVNNTQYDILCDKLILFLKWEPCGSFYDPNKQCGVLSQPSEVNESYSSLLQSHWKQLFEAHFHSDPSLSLNNLQLCRTSVPHICASLEDHITGSTWPPDLAIPASALNPPMKSSSPCQRSEVEVKPSLSPWRRSWKHCVVFQPSESSGSTSFTHCYRSSVGVEPLGDVLY